MISRTNRDLLAAINACPPQVAAAIFERLSPRDLAVCACVCRAWRESMPYGGLVRLRLPRSGRLLRGFNPERLQGAPHLREIIVPTAACAAWPPTLSVLRAARLPSLQHIEIQHWSPLGGADVAARELEVLAEAMRAQRPECRLTLAVNDRDALTALAAWPGNRLNLSRVDANLPYLHQSAADALAKVAAARGARVGVWVCRWAGCEGLGLDAALDLRRRLGGACAALGEVRVKSHAEWARVAALLAPLPPPAPPLEALEIDLTDFWWAWPVAAAAMGVAAGGEEHAGEVPPAPAAAAAAAQPPAAAGDPAAPAAAAAAAGEQRAPPQPLRLSVLTAQCEGSGPEKAASAASISTSAAGGSLRRLALKGYSPGGWSVGGQDGGDSGAPPLRRLLCGVTSFSALRDTSSAPLPLRPLVPHLAATLTELVLERAACTAAGCSHSGSSSASNGHCPASADDLAALARLAALELLTLVLRDCGACAAAATAHEAAPAAAAAQGGPPVAQEEQEAPTPPPPDLSWLRRLGRLRFARLGAPLLDLSWLPEGLEALDAAPALCGTRHRMALRVGGFERGSSSGSGDDGGAVQAAPRLPALRRIELPPLLVGGGGAGGQGRGRPAALVGEEAAAARLLAAVAAACPRLEVLDADAWRAGPDAAAGVARALQGTLRRLTLAAAKGQERAAVEVAVRAVAAPWLELELC